MGINNVSPKSNTVYILLYLTLKIHEPSVFHVCVRYVHLWSNIFPHELGFHDSCVLQIKMNVIQLIREAQLQQLEQLEAVDVRVPRVVLKDRSDPFISVSEDEFIQRFRLPKDCVRDLIDEISPRVPRVQPGKGTFTCVFLSLISYLCIDFRCCWRFP